MRRYELLSLTSLPYQAQLVTSWEITRFADIIREWKRTNKTPTAPQEFLIESLVRFHICEQRLFDRRIFWNGDRTNYRQVEDHHTDILREDNQRKEREFLKYMPMVQSWKLSYLKLALASKIEIGADIELASLFQALDTKHRDNGKESQDIFRRSDNR